MLLLVPLIELLLLLLFLLLVTLLYRRGGMNQRMRDRRSGLHLLWLRWLGVAIRRLYVAILGRLRGAILRLRSSLLLVGSRLRLRHLLDLVVAAVRLAKWTEAILRRSRRAAWISRGRLRGTYGAN